MMDALTELPIDPLDAMAQRACREPFFLAFHLAAHRRRFHLTPDEQRRHLGVRVEDWTVFQLCRAPLVETWGEDLVCICGRFHANRERLEGVLRGQPPCWAP